MKRNRPSAQDRRQIDSTLDRLSSGRSMPKSVLVLLVALYVIPSVATTVISRSQGVIMLAGNAIPTSVLPGVLTSFANMCVILMVVFFGRLGLIVALSILLVQFPLLFRSLFVFRAFNSIPGFTMNVFTIIFCILIYYSGRRVEKAQGKLLEQAVTDGLTGLPNRLACSELINQLIEHGKSFALVSIDINTFKSLNDTMGHGTGNAVLVEIASRWKAVADAGAGDAEEMDFIARQGGDEFAFVLRDYGSDAGIRAKIAASFFGELVRKTGTDITLSVNVSVRHLMKNGFVEELREVLQTSGVPAEQLEIEITESIVIDSADTALRCINEIRGMGVKIAIDDFGTGYSSLSYLNSFPADLLKVDKSFIDTMNSSDSSRQYVAAIISIGHIMHFHVISEGVEEPSQLDTLRSIGCDYIQGFIWGRPMPPEAAAELVMQACV